MAPVGWELLVPACTSKTLVGPGKVRGSHGCSSWPPGCAAGLAATCVWGQDADAEHCCCAPPPTKDPLPRASVQSRGGVPWEGRPAGASELLVRSPGCTWCGGCGEASRHRGGGSAACAAGGSWAPAMSGHTRDGGPRSPHGVNSNPMPGENEGQINSAGATSSLAWRSAKLCQN